jgi:uncharacterized protein
MTQPANSREPSVEVILASIRRKIADDEPAKESPPNEAASREPPPAAAPMTPMTPPPARLAPADDSAPAMRDEEITSKLAELRKISRQAPRATAEATERSSEPASEGHLSPATTAALDAAFNTLARTAQPRGGRTVEELVTELIRPMLKTWLDDNLPALSERLVRAEVERVSRAQRLNADGQEDRLALLRDMPPEPPQDLSPQEAEIWRATVDGMKAQDLMLDFDEFCAQVNKLDAGSAGGIEKTTDIKEYQAALATFRAVCEQLARSITLRQGRIPDRGQPPPAPRQVGPIVWST